MAGFLSASTQDRTQQGRSSTQAEAHGRTLTLRLRVGELTQDQVSVPVGLSQVWVGMGQTHPVLLKLDSDLLPAESLPLLSATEEGYAIRVLPKTVLTLYGTSELTVKGNAADPERSAQMGPGRHRRFVLKLEPYTLEGWWDTQVPLPLPSRTSELDPVLVGLHLFFYAVTVLVLLLVGNELTAQRLEPPALEDRWAKLQMPERDIPKVQTVLLDKKIKKKLKLKPLQSEPVSRPDPAPERIPEVKPTPRPAPEVPPPAVTPEPVRQVLMATPVPRIKLPELPDLPAQGAAGPGRGISGGTLGNSVGQARGTGGGVGELPQPGSAKGSGGVTGGYALLGSTGGRSQGSGVGELPMATGRSGGSGGITGGNLALPSGTGGARSGGGVGELQVAQGSGGRSGGGISGGSLLGGGTGGRGSGGSGVGELSGPGSAGTGGGVGGGSGSGGLSGGTLSGGGGGARLQSLRAMTWTPPTGEGAFISETERERLERRLSERTCRITGAVGKSLGQSVVSSDGSFVYLEGSDGIKARIPIQPCGSRVRPLLNLPSGRRSLSQIEALQWCLDRLG